MADSPQSIPLEAFHRQRGARFVPFAGWSMPVQYTGIIQEHLAVRQKAGIFDVSHMGEIALSGRDAVSYLNALLTQRFEDLQPGASRYALMCDPLGGVVDDLIVYCLAPDEFMICVNAGNRAKDFAWMLSHADGRDLVLEDQSDQFGLLAVQGPLAAEWISPLLPDGDSLPARFHHCRTHLAGVPVLLSRTGYTGEDGFELYLSSGDMEKVALALEARGQALGLACVFCGLGARDSLRLEAGYPLYGHEISETIDPLTAGLGWTIKWKKAGGFVGQSALESKRAAGLARKLVFFKLEDRRIGRQGEKLWHGNEAVGEVLSGSYSPLIEKAIGSALVATDAAGLELELRLRGQPSKVQIARPPLHL
jgi:aminomethyltransferase